MKFQKRNDYNYHDANQALLLIAEKEGIENSKMAATCSLAPAAFASYLDRVVFTSHPNHSALALGLNISSPTSRTIVSFRERDFQRLGILLGKACGYQEGFPSVRAMIGYAQNHYLEATDKNWVKTDYPSPEEEMKFKHKQANLSLYKRAANLWIKRLGLPFSRLMPNEPLFSNYLIGGYCNLSDDGKIRKLGELAGAIGMEYQEKPFTLDQMLAQARKFYPEEFPDRDLAVSQRTPRVK